MSSPHDVAPHGPLGPVMVPPSGRWIVQSAIDGGIDPDSGYKLHLWTLTLRHADSGHLEQVETWAREGTYEAGQTVHGDVVRRGNGGWAPRFKRDPRRAG